jgi:Ring finger domain
MPNSFKKLKPIPFFKGATQTTKMECSICQDTIEASGGHVTLACQHHYHLGCIGRWLLKSETCPMCRQETSDKEKILKNDERMSWAEEEEEDEEDAFSEEDTDIPEFNEAAHALWVMRKTFEMLEDGQSIQSETSTRQVIDPEHDGIHIVRQRQRREGLHWLLDDDRGYESA